MNTQLEGKLALFIENAQAMKEGFAWKNPMTRRLSAIVCVLENKPVDCGAISACHTMLKGQTGVFSYFRGDLSVYIATMMSLTDQPKQRLTDTLYIYGLLKDQGFHASDYLVAAAYQIAAGTDGSHYEHAVTRAKGFYDAMKANHRFYTGRDDYIFSVMLGLSDIDITEGADKMERLYQTLKPEFMNGNSVQALSQVLVLGGDSGETCTGVLRLRDTLRGNGIKLDKSYTLPALGVLSLLTADMNAVVSDMMEAKDTLRASKGFGAFSVTSQELLLYAASLVSSVYADGIKNGVLKAAVSTGITNLIIAQQAAMIAAVTSAGAAANASVAASH